ncbi:MAG: bifunctional phosphoribosylaminoimidazolecarboxamide formyltransferase/IMP cyclohydrolase [Synergistaceae bacterium]|jgi:phosphoribosylaminoimidazolecarboxamide formyltransferase/IMP cyclohydrolase|nr:bifunctional phosphoribosylaminoimidazolecarboxamide formyltransferase/IMP cyclohydrolase [Synergistaceae bacterium]
MPECRVKRALISVSDKTGIVDFAKGLAALGAAIVSTGGTRKVLVDAGIPVIYISEVTGFPEILDGRVKTLHPAVHGGILARRSDPRHVQTLSEQNIAPIDLVAVNLYPFRETAARPGVTWDDLIENIDIGGPSMVRSAAKNHEDVLVIVNPEDYGGILARLRAEGDCPSEERRRLAAAAFRHTADYDACIAETLSVSAAESAPPKAELFPPRLTLAAERAEILRYGENPGQAAALYRFSGGGGKSSFGKSSFIDAAQLQGKELSYNNWLDADSAFRLVRDLREAGSGGAAAVIVKHTNPCGAAVGETVEEAFEKAYASDPVSAFGGIAAFSRPVTEALAQRLREVFWEVVIAPAYSAEALKILSVKTNLRLLEVSLDVDSEGGAGALEWRSVSGGLLAQESDTRDSPAESWKTVTKRGPSAAERRDLFFAWKVVKHVKSNAIVLAKDGAVVGVGAGQMNRVGAAAIALRQAGEKARGAVLASDAFFPFADTVRLAAAGGVSAVVQPGGSLKDRESADAADEAGMAMLHTGTRHFKH